MFAVSFVDAGKLWFLLAVAGLVGLYVVLQRRRQQYVVRFTNLALLDQVAPRRPGWRRHAAAAGFIVALASLVVAFARPTQQVREPRERATVMLAIDTSLSMQATDVPPSRLKAAQDAARSFLKSVPPSINIGLVSFNGSARVDVAPTTERQRVQTAIDSLALGESTAIGDAISTSVDAIAAFARQTASATDTEPVPAAIVLMSDGDTNKGLSNEEGAAKAKQARIPVTTIAFGTDRGEITIPGNPAPAAVYVNKDALRRIAEATSGSFFAASSEAQLAQVYQRIGSSIGFQDVEREITEWFIGIGLLALAATAAMSLAWFNRLP